MGSWWTFIDQVGIVAGLILFVIEFFQWIIMWKMNEEMENIQEDVEDMQEDLEDIEEDLENDER